MNTIETNAMCLPCKNADTREWFAWNDLRPPEPDYFHLTGEVWVANPGVDPLLTSRDPQGINPKILLLDLFLCQQQGLWPQVLVWKPVRFDKKISEGFSEVHVMCEDSVIAEIQVIDTH